MSLKNNQSHQRKRTLISTKFKPIYVQSTKVHLGEIQSVLYTIRVISFIYVTSVLVDVVYSVSTLETIRLRYRLQGTRPLFLV